MAQPLKAEAAKSTIDPVFFKGRIKDIRRMKADAQDKNGQAGQATGQLVENTNLDRRAVSLAVTLAGMESAKRATIVADYITVLKLMDFLDEPGLFGTPKAQGEKAAAEIVKASADAAAAPAPAGAAPPPPVDEFDAAAPPKPDDEPVAETTAAAPRGRGRPRKDADVKAAADRAENKSKAKLSVVPKESPGVSGTDLQAQIDKAGMTDAPRPKGFH